MMELPKRHATCLFKLIQPVRTVRVRARAAMPFKFPKLEAIVILTDHDHASGDLSAMAHDGGAGER
jgi:hypothetical protein